MRRLGVEGSQMKERIVVVPMLLAAACGSGEDSIALEFPNESARAATQQIEIYAFSKEAVGVGTARLTCADLLGKLVKGEPPQGDPVANPIEPPFDGRTIPGFPSGDPVVFVVGYDDKTTDKKPILEGCTQEFDTGGNSFEVTVKLEKIIPDDARLVKEAGDRQVGHAGSMLGVPLRVYVDGSLPGKDERYRIPGVEIVFTPPPEVALAQVTTPLSTGPGANGAAEVQATLPANSQGDVFTIGVKAPELTKNNEDEFRISAIEPVDFPQSEQIGTTRGRVPIAVAIGDVTGTSRLDAVLLSCDGGGFQCKPGVAAGTDDTGKPVAGALGTTKIEVVDDLGGMKRVSAVNGELGILPSGLFVGRLVPTPGDKDDIGFSNSRRADCQGRADGPCEGSEVTILSGSDAGPTFVGRYAMTTSNAVGLAAFKKRRTDEQFSLLTAGQGRSRQTRPCTQAATCFPHVLMENGVDVCIEHPERCGCPPNERCECLSGDCRGVPGVCVAQDKDIDQLINHFIDSSPTRTSTTFENDEGCHQPELVCEKTGQSVLRKECKCGDSFRANSCSSVDNCGCTFPTRVTIGAFGASQLPFGLAAGALRNTGYYDIVVPTVGGLDFVEFKQVGGFRWKVQRNINAPIHTATVVDMDPLAGSPLAPDVVWVSAKPCLDEVNPNRQCPLVRPVVEGETAQGCLGMYLRKSMMDAIDEEKEDGCHRFFLYQRPDGLCAGDFNGDGEKDIAISSIDSGEVAVFLGDGLGGLLDPPDKFSLGPSAKGGPLACRDVDGDRKTDILVASQATGDLILLKARAR